MKNMYKSQYPKWRPESNIDSVILSLSEGIYMPTIKDYKDAGQSYCYNAIIAYPTGQIHFAKKLGLKFKHKPSGYWKNEDHVLRAILYIAKDGYMPLKREFSNNGISACYIAMSIYHSGRESIAAKLYLKLHRAPANYYDDKRNIRRDVLSISKDGQFPTERTFHKKNFGGLYMKILEVFGRAIECANYCGLIIMNHPNGYWQSLENVIEKLEEIAKGSNTITSQLFIDNNCQGLLSGINLYHGGLLSIAEKIGKRTKKKTPGYYESYEKVLEEMQEFEYDLGFPTIKMFSDAGKVGLYRGMIKYHNGTQNIAQKLDLPFISDSGPERIIRKILNQHQIQFKRNHTFKDCKYIMPLRFDFFLVDYNTIIEYNGEQHYKPIDMWEGQKGFEKQRIKDRIKVEYCRENNIRLIIIPYRVKNLPDEVAHYLNGL